MRCLPLIHADYKMWPGSQSCSQSLSWITKPTFHHLHSTEAACALSLPRLSVKTVKRIPRASRDRSARKLANILDQVTSGDSEASWNRLFCFAPRCLRVPDRGAIAEVWHRASICLSARNRTQPPTSCSLYLTEGTTDLLVIPWKPWQHEFLLSWKMEIFNKGAVRLASSEDSIAKPNSESLCAVNWMCFF